MAISMRHVTKKAMAFTLRCVHLEDADRCDGVSRFSAKEAHIRWYWCKTGLGNSWQTLVLHSVAEYTAIGDG